MLLRALLLLGLALPAAAGPRLVFVKPGGPGSTEKAQQVMDDFAAALGIEGAAATYFNETEAALAFIDEQQPAFGIVSLDFFLSQRKKLKLEPLALTRPGGRTTQRWSLLVPADSTLTLDGLAGKRVAGTGLGDDRFVSAVLLGGRYDAARELKLVRSRSPLRAIRAVLRGKADALLLDQDGAESLGKLKRYAAKLKVAHTFGPLPAAPVVRIGGRGDADALVAALLKLDSQAKGKKLLETFKLAGFARMKPKSYAAVVTAYDGWKPKKK